ncbi:serine-threonine protein kinase [Streptomyces tsukubensis]|uniref:Serine-threonine protein kinase n=2 Tax=Streptomyces TaxID=1883 RepID=A0A7G3UNX0_STRT9|nr:serine-threonine protein kinase [Streptomyces tsukubensis]AZK98273.1 serine-threonine protein kinase [Streptomyces tsukubensis]QKM71966.1 serine-threonine protein kinase [Streptomyces tsukubensis NRRL18488]TAI40515.1 serine-threonine protein kinase [Streptomyces tsukubensis]
MPRWDVGPYQDIGFDRDGDVDPEQRHRLLGLEVTDLVMFAHGRNHSPVAAREMYEGFFAALPELVGRGVRPGFAGVGWPSMTFPDEPPGRPGVSGRLPGPPAGGGAAGEKVAGPVTAGGEGLDPTVRQSLVSLFPGHRETVARMGALLAERPESAAAVTEFGRLARRLAEAPAGGLESACFTDDLPGDEQGPPALLFEDPLSLCRRFAGVLERVESEAAGAGFRGAPGPGGEDPGRLGAGRGGLWHGGAGPAGVCRASGAPQVWRGARELLRQTTYYALKRRAGAVGELGLGPLLGQLARSRPALRVHLVGHGQGARLVAFALRGLPDGVRTVKSVTLLQGAFSHYAFATALPHAPGRSGALRAMEHRVDGPVVACHSRYDSALGALYPVASAPAHDGHSPVPAGSGDPRWWAMGHSGIHGVEGTVRLSLDEALAEGLPRSGCVSVDASSVVRDGAPPSGAHADVRRPELARLVVTAGRLGD